MVSLQQWSFLCSLFIANIQLKEYGDKKQCFKYITFK